MSKSNKVKQVAEALLNIIDHGAGCACTMCQADNKLLNENPDIVDAVANLAKNKTK